MRERLAKFLFRRLYVAALRRKPDFTIGPVGDDYMRRWHVLPRNPVCNIYLHEFLHSDDDRALHDHPWWNVSFLLYGTYVEHTIGAGGVHHRKQYRVGDLKFKFATAAHRVELVGDQCWSLFCTGPKVRDWGFHCPTRWVPWQEYTTPGDKGRVGRGCG